MLNLNNNGERQHDVSNKYTAFLDTKQKTQYELDRAECAWSLGESTLSLFGCGSLKNSPPKTTALKPFSTAKTVPSFVNFNVSPETRQPPCRGVGGERHLRSVAKGVGKQILGHIDSLLCHDKYGFASKALEDSPSALLENLQRPVADFSLHTKAEVLLASTDPEEFRKLQQSLRRSLRGRGTTMSVRQALVSGKLLDERMKSVRERAHEERERQQAAHHAAATKDTVRAAVPACETDSNLSLSSSTRIHGPRRKSMEDLLAHYIKSSPPSPSRSFSLRKTFKKHEGEDLDVDFDHSESLTPNNGLRSEETRASSNNICLSRSTTTCDAAEEIQEREQEEKDLVSESMAGALVGSVVYSMRSRASGLSSMVRGQARPLWGNRNAQFSCTAPAPITRTASQERAKCQLGMMKRYPSMMTCTSDMS